MTKMYKKLVFTQVNFNVLCEKIKKKNPSYFVSVEINRKINYIRRTIINFSTQHQDLTKKENSTRVSTTKYDNIIYENFRFKIYIRCVGTPEQQN